MTRNAVASPSKINLSFEVLGRRPDGYHEIVTVFQALDFSDEIAFDWDSGESGLVCAHPGVPGGQANLMVRALNAVEKYVGRPLSVKITLDKKIPMGAGLGGGSGNAAAVLREAGRKFNVPAEALYTIAAELGADVPFFLTGGTALGTGKGEILRPLPALPRFSVVLVKPPFSISTAAAYGKISRFSSGEKTGKLVEAITARRCDSLFSRFANDFEEPLFLEYPRLKEIKETLLGGGALAAQLSGSGSAVFAFARGEEHARELARLAGKFGFARTAHTS